MCDSFTASKDNWKQAKTNCDEKEVALKMSGKKGRVIVTAILILFENIIRI